MNPAKFYRHNIMATSSTKLTHSIFCLARLPPDPIKNVPRFFARRSETYIGGHVECLETGVYRADIPCKFNLKPSALQQLIDNIDRDLTFFIEVEGGVDRTTIANYDEVRSEIVEALELLRDTPEREEVSARNCYRHNGLHPLLN